MDSEYNHSGHQGIMTFLQRYKEYENEKENTNTFIKDLMMYTEEMETYLRKEINHLHQQMGDVHLDLESATKGRAGLQQRVKDMETRLGVVPDLNPYVMVLIDGDGLIFREQFVKQGLIGGRKAADELRKAVAQKFSSSTETELEVLAKVVANVPGLSKAMKYDGCVDDEATLYEFISGFNQAKAHFDFMDVGHGKERADAKILECTRFHIRNFNCKQILLGISHDAGYAPFLNNIVHSDDTKQRITILEGTPTVENIVETGIAITSFNKIFRTEKLLAKSTTNKPTSIVPANGVSYAAVTQSRADPPPQITLPIPLKDPAMRSMRPSKQPTPPWNPGPHGCDPPIKVNVAVVEKLKKRKDSEKLCNNHFLRGPCSRGDDCDFVHNYCPTKEEKKVIELFSRLNRCCKGQDCQTTNCIYGHNCPSIIDGVCQSSRCKFSVEEHPPNTKFKYPRHSE
ncbi:hypothetical protein F4804DRAFT_354043 [Jackrogersella minutella]|nr:hypothetical protein F4804DRAFT_354043 [Jackrogersella minutella]